MPGRDAKYAKIFEALRRDIRAGRYPLGRPLPSEEAIVRKYGVSRITAKRALDELAARGLVFRRRGSGSFATPAARAESGLLGLVMPSLAFGEVFPEICRALVRRAGAEGFSFLLGDISAPEPDARAGEAIAVARSFVDRRVAGVVFQPLAFLDRPEGVTREILSLFDDAGIPVVLIDRDAGEAAVGRPRDFVGMDNFAAGRAVGAHLLERGVKRVRFLLRPNCASTIRDRLDGVASALGAARPRDFAIVAEPGDAAALAPVFRRRSRPDAVVCESDYVAAIFRATLATLGVSVPDDVMLAGFDDVRFATAVSPPLTTVRQPCDDIARIAFATLRERMRDPTLPPRRILLSGALVVRDSTRGNR